MFSLLNVSVGWYLAVRQIRRANLWTSALTVFIMLLTFLNLVVVSGVLIGIVDGISDLFRKQLTGDVYLSALETERYINRSSEIVSFLGGLPDVAHVTARYTAGGTIEANYKGRSNLSEEANISAASIVGIDPVAEEAFSGISKFVKEGSMLAENDFDAVLIGSQLIERYSFGGDLLPNIQPLRDVYPGDRVRVTINGATREMVIRGIILTTANSPLAAKVIMPAAQLREMLGRDDYNVNEIAVALTAGSDPIAVSELLKRSGIADVAKVRTAAEAIPGGVAEVRATFALLGNAFSSIGLIVAAITIFIVIFINALTRRKYIGILKGIGISGSAIEIAYMFQSFFYAVAGSAIGLALLYGFLVPYIGAHPIELPISNAILVAPPFETFARVLLLVVVTVIAGYIPSRMIVKKNTLDSILGRE